MRKTFRTVLKRAGSGCTIPLPFDPREVFGRARPPVKVTLKGHSYRSTIFSMGKGPFVPLRRSHREAAGLEGNETLQITLELDTEKREVAVPADLGRALRRRSSDWAAWNALSFTARREQAEAVEGAKAAETRQRRIEKALALVRARKPASAPRRAVGRTARRERGAR